MKTILRLYLRTSKGNDPFLYRQLTAMNIRPKYDQHLHAFYLDAPFSMLFHLSFHSMIVENMYVQIGKPFPAINQQTFKQYLQKIQFKNFLPLKRGLVQNLTLNILVRETQYPLSDNVMASLFNEHLHKEILRRQYNRQILAAAGVSSRDNLLPFYDMKEIVQRKWEEEDLKRQSQQIQLLETHSPYQLEGRTNSIIKAHHIKPSEPLSQQIIEKSIDQALASELAYHPHLTFYVRRNQGRILLKVNTQQMYKHGWKKRVGWAPIRQSIVAAILDQTGILKQQLSSIKIWDPFCGSGTFALVAAAKFYSLQIRNQIQQNFNWQHWSIYKKQYLQQYIQESRQKMKEREGKLKLICSDISFQAVNYTIGNIKQILNDMPELTVKQSKPSVKRLKPTDQIYEFRNSQWSVLCGDFQKIAQNVLLEGQRVNIVTNLPYTESRSAKHIQLNQLTSIYRRFNKMINDFKDRIANVFVVINNNPQYQTSPYHFLNVSSQKWHQITSFQSGGLPISLLAWSQNQIQSSFIDPLTIYNEIAAEHRQIQTLPEDDDVHNSLVKYRQKIRDIEKKNYFIPQHLLKFKRGYRRVVEKRRRRHLLQAYELFSRRRDKMIAFTEYSRKKLEVKMIKRGSIWRKRNIRLLQGINIENLQNELKKEFEGRIEEALKRSQQREALRQLKLKNRKQELEQKKQEKHLFQRKRHLARNPGLLQKQQRQQNKPAKIKAKLRK